MASSRNVLYIGIRGNVLAIDRVTGEEVWRTALKGSDFVNVVEQNGELFASARGELFRLDPTTGKILWHNPLSGLGWGFVTIAGGGTAPMMAEKKRRDQQAAAAAAAT